MGFDFPGDINRRPVKVCRASAEQLLSLRAAVAPDGHSATFGVQFTNQRPFRCEIPYSTMPAFFAEIRHAVALMTNRQVLRPDRGAERMLELCQLAMRPAAIEIMVDPLTGDRLFLFQFHDHAPISLRISAVELPFMLQQLAQAISRSLN